MSLKFLKMLAVSSTMLAVAGNTALGQVQMNAPNSSEMANMQGKASILNPQREAPAATPAQDEIKAGQPQNLPIRIITRDVFCKRLQLTFTEYAVNNGFSKVQTAMLASTASEAVIQEFRQGRATDYMKAATLAHFASQPGKAKNETYLQLASFIGSAMGLSSKVSMALSTGELRFIPYAQQDSDIVVIAQNAVPLTPERATKIVEVARSLKIRISALWVGDESIENSDLEKTRMLGWIVGMTGGFLTNLGGTTSACDSVM